MIYYTVDVKNWWSGAPFYYPGEHCIVLSDTLTIYITSMYTSLLHLLTSVPDSRYELHPRVCGTWSVGGLLPLSLANGQQPIPRWAPHPEPRGYFLLGVNLLRALQKEDFLENLKWGQTTKPEDIVYITIAGVRTWKHLESGKQETDFVQTMTVVCLWTLMGFFFQTAPLFFLSCFHFLLTTLQDHKCLKSLFPKIFRYEAADPCQISQLTQE